MQKFIIICFTLLLVISCSTDYDGSDAVSDNPTIILSETDNTIVSYALRLDWFGTIGDGTGIDYYYCVTTDTSITTQTAVAKLSSDKWINTAETFAQISFPMVPFNSDVIFYRDSIYQDIDNQTSIKIAFSKVLIFAQNSIGTCSPVTGRLYQRINQKPQIISISSEELSFSSEKETVDVYEDKMILPSSNSYAVPIDFEWQGEDKDFYSSMEFRWELWENTGDTGILVTESDWSTDYSVELNDDLYYHNSEGDYSFKVFVRDDALEVADTNITVNFSVFAPTFEKGILFIDDTDPALYPPSGSLYMGNPNAVETRVFYESILNYAGYKPEGEATDSLLMYRIRKYIKTTEVVGYDTIWFDDDDDPSTPDVIDMVNEIRIGLYSPYLREISNYRLVVIMSDDRSNTNGVDWVGEPPYTGYAEVMKQYLDVGGKAFILGSSALMGKYYTSPDQLPINNYVEPYKQVFDPYAPVVATLGSSTKEFFRDYFGIFSMTFPEQKTYLTIATSTGLPYTSQFAMDKGVKTDNYDFIGVTVNSGVTDQNFKPARIDSSKVNDAWWNRPLNTIISTKLALKDNGTVFTGVPTFEVFKGERIYLYESLYNLPSDPFNDSLVIDGDMTHSLWWKDPVTHTHGPILHRTGIVASRYIADNDQFRTAFFGLPTYFLDNSDNQMSDMFKAMIDWFDLEKDPLGE